MKTGNKNCIRFCGNIVYLIITSEANRVAFSLNKKGKKGLCHTFILQGMFNTQLIGMNLILPFS